MGVQRKMVGNQRDVRGEESGKPSTETSIDDERLGAPEESMVDEDELCAGARSTLEELEGGRHTAHDPRDLVRPDHLETHGTELRPLLHLEQVAREGHDVVAARHGQRS